MKKYQLFTGAALALSGCMITAEQQAAQDEITYQQYRYMSCKDLRTRWVAGSPVLGMQGTLLMGTGWGSHVAVTRQELKNLELTMKRKGCRLPEGVS